jgi:Tfp pilus assembly protein PilX
MVYPPSQSRRGFALLITITLLAFLVLLLVSLASLTRVETQVASNNQALSQARQNALLAFNLALGQLQKYVGPDQRVTARADILSVAPAPGNALWTGVWGNSQPSSAISTTGTLLNWLVSGNEAATFDFSKTGATFGRITTTSAGIAKTPAIALTTTGPTPTGVTLVGANSVGSAGADQVIAPLMSITVPASQLPGFDSTDSTATPIGRYAFWVGDEGVKARANLVDPTVVSPVAHPPLQSWATAQRTGIEATSLIGPNYPINDSSLKKALGLNQLSLVASTITRANVASRFHDITFTSRSVLADVAAGGLKKDLTNWLAATPAQLSALGVGVAPQDTDLIFKPADLGAPATIANEFGLPAWGLLRSFDATRYDGSTALAPQLQTSTVQGIAPVVTYARLGFSISGALGGSLNVHLHPVVVLWNPYNVPIAAASYQLGFNPGYNSSGRVIEFRSGSATGTVLGALLLDQASVTASAPASQTNGQYFTFTVDTLTLEPGQSYVLSYNQGTNSLSTSGLTTPDPSMVLSTGGTALTATTMAAPVYWIATQQNGANPWAGGGFEVTLRSTASGTPSASYQDIDTFSYHQMQNIGFGTPVMPSPTNLSSIGPLGSSPQFVMTTEALMARSPQTFQNRWIAQQNLRAPISTRTQFESWFYNSSYGGSNSSYGSAVTNSVSTPVFAGGNASAGLQVQGGTANPLVLAEILPAGLPLMSLGQLQNANLSLLDIYPANAVANSHPNHRLAPDQVVRSTSGLAGGTTSHPVTLRIRYVYDISYGLNRALWDQYFFSSVPSALTQANIDDGSYQLPNSRHTFYRDNAATLVPGDLVGAPAFSTAAAHLLLDGGFNINSTSAEAWAAVLGSLNQLAYNPVSGGAGPALAFPFSRFVKPKGGSSDAWTGYRTLTQPQITQLATNIVAEIKTRGPFLSLADFVNRRLVTGPAGTKGALQAALDATATGSGATNPSSAAASTAYPAVPSTQPPDYYYVDQMRGGTANTSPYGTLAAFAPGMVSQADILSTLGATLTARSDTFSIRTYGEVLNPVTGASEGKAWAEAVVQRLPDYVDPSDASLLAANGGTGAATPPAATGTANQTYGRRFGVVSFRWLTPNDI